MPRDDQQALILYKLSYLEDRPDEQYRLAVQLLDKERGYRVVMAALAVVRERAAEDARPVLHRLFEWCMQSGVKRDPGCYVRTAIIQAMSAIANQSDVPVALQALETYEFLPPTHQESAAGLRAVGLLLLNGLDDTMARLSAVKLLVDEHTSRMSGEPAVSAAQVLAEMDEALPLYMYLLDNRGGRRSPEVLAECLRSLRNVPTPVLDLLIERFKDTDDDLVLTGLLDLITGHEERATYIPFLQTFLLNTTRTDVYRYLCTTVVAEHREDLIGMLQGMAGQERNKEKREILVGALELVRK